MSTNQVSESMPPVGSTSTVPVSERPASAPAWRVGRWVRWLLAGNPFYLLSAVLLLYGAYRLTLDPELFGSELRQLVVNFGSLQLYEMLAIGTAILLARRSLWYDSMLLLVLENLLVFVPFILLSQAVFLGGSAFWSLCGAGLLLAGLRHRDARRHIPRLNFASTLSACGAAFLAVHLAFPAMFRWIHWAGDALTGEEILHQAIHQSWFVVLAPLAALANWLPRPRQWGGLLPARSWLPLVVLTLWLAATAVHLAAIGFVYSFPWRWVYLAPLVWAASLTFYNRLGDLAPEPSERWRKVVMTMPLPVTWWLLAGGENAWFVVSALLNAVFYGVSWARRRDDGVARGLVVVALATLCAGLPGPFADTLGLHVNQEGWIGWCLSGAVLAVLGLSRNPVFAVIGAMITLVTVSTAAGGSDHAVRWGLQWSLVFLLAHSLRWSDAEHRGANLVRWTAAIGWLINTVTWGGSQAPPTVAWSTCLLLLGGVGLRKLITGDSGPMAVPATGLAAMVTAPGKVLFFGLGDASAGLLALAGSFALFGAGTALALTRHLWCQSERGCVAPSPPPDPNSRSEVTGPVADSTT